MKKPKRDSIVIERRDNVPQGIMKTLIDRLILLADEIEKRVNLKKEEILIWICSFYIFPFGENGIWYISAKVGRRKKSSPGRNKETFLSEPKESDYNNIIVSSEGFGIKDKGIFPLEKMAEIISAQLN